MDIESYSHQILERGQYNYFKLQWGNIVLRNFNGRGNLVNFKSVKQSRKKNYKTWIRCDIYLFRDISNNNQVFPVFVCSSCMFMKTITFLPLDQNKADLERHKCLHSRMCDVIEELHGGYLNMWNINLNHIGQNDKSFQVQLNIDKKYETLFEDKYMLAAVFDIEKSQITLLHTFAKVKVPECQTCTMKPCPCLR